MLPNRAYATVPTLSPVASHLHAQPEGQPALVIAAAAADGHSYAVAHFTHYHVHTTNEALRMIETARPRVVVVDWDTPEIDGLTVCAAARKFAHTAILVVMAAPERAPAALKAGCHGILLKPFAPNLVAARVGRLAREMPSTPVALRAASAMNQAGTNRVWPDTPCPSCSAPSSTSFEFSSYRRMWYACLACDAVWLGARQE